MTERQDVIRKKCGNFRQISRLFCGLSAILPIDDETNEDVYWLYRDASQTLERAFNTGVRFTTSNEENKNLLPAPQGASDTLQNVRIKGNNRCAGAMACTKEAPQ